MLIKLKGNDDIINLYNVAAIIPDREGTLGLKFKMIDNSLYVEKFDTEAELDARIEELMGYNIGLTAKEYNEALDTAEEIAGE